MHRIIPCYDEPENVVPAHNGTWVVTTEITKESIWGGKRIMKLVVEHANSGKANNVSHLRSGVDSGQLGVFDADSYPLTDRRIDAKQWYEKICKLTLEPPCYGVYTNGVCSSSGLGDGDYAITVHDYDGKAVKIEAVFMERDEEDENDDYENDYNDEEDE